MLYDKSEKLKLAEELQSIEERKHQFETQKQALTSHYYKSGEIVIYINTDDYTHKGCNEPIEFSDGLLLNYIEQEIKELTELSDSIIKRLTEL